MEKAAYYDGDGYFISRTITKGSPYGRVMGIDPPQVIGDKNHERNAVFRADTTEDIGGWGLSLGKVETEASMRLLSRCSPSRRQEHTVNRFYVWRGVFKSCGSLIEGKLVFNHAL